MPEITLFQARVIHSPEDFGDSRETAVRELIREVGPEQAEKILSGIAEVWEKVEAMARQLGLYGMPLDIFLDGLDANTLDIPEKVRKLASDGVAMYVMAEELQMAGAIVHGTESHALLMEERTMSTTGANPGKALELLENRDIFIAERITEVMSPDKMGFLLIGREHDVPKHLSDDFLVKDFG